LTDPVDTHLYWNVRAPHYAIYDVLGRNILEQYITPINRVTPIKSLIDVGCGKGELFPLWCQLKIPRLVGYDFSEEMLEISRRRVERHGLPIELYHADIRETPYPEQFDFAVTRTVLMHIPAVDIERAAVNLSKMSNNLMLFEYSEKVATKELNRWCWLHDYTLVFEDLGYRQIAAIQRPDIPQTLFHFKRE